ncbi:MAG: NUDIX hydrolase [Anaerolineae bacterium]|nr:NUDIX hydrolase [Anaerolineae bacterium]
MNEPPPTITNAAGIRRFACFPACVLVFVVNRQEQILMLSHPKANGAWEVVNGALEHGETVLEGALRELGEEAGPDLQARPLGVVHVYTHHYDAKVHGMISVAYLVAYESGEALPGDDMAGSTAGWFDLQTIQSDDFKLLVPRQRWLFARAIELYRLWRDADIPPLEKAPGEHGGIKYSKT